MSIVVLQQTIASLFKRKGKAVVPAKELELLASMELRWFEPTEMRKLINLATDLGLLEETGDGLKTMFDHNSTEIPIGFKPPKDLLTALDHDLESLFMQIVNHICLVSGLEQKKVIGEINKKQAELEEYVTLEVLAILYAKQKNIDVDKYIPMVKDQLISNPS